MNFFMKKVFWHNPYQRSLDTKVLEVENDKILLEETIAYSFSGGQESDKGTINNFSILNSEIKNNLIYYFLPEGHGLLKGDPVKMEIDWQRRYRLMRLHFAAELVLEIVTKNFNLQKTGAHIAEHKSRIDFMFNGHISTLFDQILSEYNKIIKNDELIQTGFSDMEKQRRYWKIEGFAQVPCGGTHVRSTSEVGFIKLKRDRCGKKDNIPVERIEITLLDNSVPEFDNHMNRNFFPK